MRPTGIATEVPQLIQIAATAAREPHPGPMIAVVFSVFWLDGYVNELVEMLSWTAELGRVKLPRRLQALVDVAAEFEKQRAQLPEKVQLLSVVLRGRPIPRGEAPYQDFDLLLAIRHRIVHPRPFRLDLEMGLAPLDEPRKIRQGLIDRGILDRTRHARMSWTIALAMPALGEWACNTAYGMGRVIADCFPAGRWRRWAHTFNPLTPEAHRRMRRAKLVSAPASE